MALTSSFSSIHSLSLVKLNRHSTIRRPNALPLVTCNSLLDDSTLLQAAKYTVDSYVENGMVIGLGSGRASGLAIQYLGRQLRSGLIKDIVGIPTNQQHCGADLLVVQVKLQRSESHWINMETALKCAHFILLYCTQLHCSVLVMIDLAFNDADVIEEETLAAVIGRQTMEGGESLIQEKTVLKSAGKLVLIVTGKQYQGAVDGSIPVLIRSINWLETAEEIDDLFLGDAEVWRRPSVGYAGPLGGDFPLVTKEGHNVLNVIFTSPIISLAEVADSLDQVDGVVEHGVISRIPCTAVIATEDGLQIVDNILKIDGSRV
ncbi:probable ribose-5-phosphate isomerase 4, chloroplastic isoform X2 [Olea europaea var. sylvestris]|uniref:probable ribose-5-phosphate isomerase 4, chloroplastic isoform X2 n=1 Tax=Olea europaea var. sylvestris TaxID=158386 RepID=UPI000C1CE626|nr:probable ribose-5-phosphate isomerase 4, chloroplastic isoform X2 [Olea europaea var. sylvestris]